MPYVYYDPNKPGDRERVYGGYFLAFISIWGSLGSAIFYLYEVAALFKGSYSEENVLYAIGWLIAMAVIDFFVLFSGIHGKEKRNMAKSYFLLFFGGMIDSTGIIAIVVSARSLCSEGTGIALLIYEILGVLIVSLVVVLLYRRIKGQGSIHIRLFTDKTLSSQINDLPLPKSRKEKSNFANSSVKECGFVYCHKCGKKLSDDSVFCSSCGSRLR